MIHYGAMGLDPRRQQAGRGQQIIQNLSENGIKLFLIVLTKMFCLGKRYARESID